MNALGHCSPLCMLNSCCRFPLEVFQHGCNYIVHNYLNSVQRPNCSFMLWTEISIAQLIERPTEKPGAILSRVRVPGAARDFFLPESTSSADSLKEYVQPRVQLHASVSRRTLKIPKAGTIPSFGHIKVLHTLIGMGSAAPAAAMP